MDLYFKKYKKRVEMLRKMFIDKINISLAENK